MKTRIVLAGGSGFIGTALARELVARESEVVLLTRSPKNRTDGVTEIGWDGERPGEWVRCLDGASAVINLTGKNINCPHTPANLRELVGSRVNSVRAIAAALASIKNSPRVWIQAGAIGFYGSNYHDVCDENSPAGHDALAEICKPWENAFCSAAAPGTRKVLLRIGFVLGRDGGALPLLAKMAKLFLGGRAGNGRQFISWIHIADLTRLFLNAIERDEWSGTFNAVAPNPVTNAEFMCELRRALRRPWSPPAPAWAVKLGARLMKSASSLALDGCHVAPRKLIKAGFEFQFPTLPAALADLCK
jgi:uncharacterized protein (TIGR01777 family)